MSFSKLPFLWFSVHQAFLIPFWIGYIIFYIDQWRLDYVYAGFLVGFISHTMLLFSWVLMEWTMNKCVFPCFFGLGLSGWAVSLFLIISLDHWLMLWLLFLFLSIPVFLSLVLWVRRKSTKKYPLTNTIKTQTTTQQKMSGKLTSLGPLSNEAKQEGKIQTYDDGNQVWSIPREVLDKYEKDEYTCKCGEKAKLIFSRKKQMCYYVCAKGEEQKCGYVKPFKNVWDDYLDDSDEDDTIMMNFA